MKLASATLEQTALRSICDAETESLRAQIFSAVTEEWFWDDACKAAYSRVKTVAKKRCHFMSWAELLEDPALSEDFRDILREAQPRRVKTEDRATRLIGALDDYRKTRAMYQMFKNGMETLKGDSVDVDRLLETVTDTLTSVKSNQELKSLLAVVGDGVEDDAAMEIAREALDEDAEKLLLSGYTDIDDRDKGCGGLPSEGVLLLGATTSGGKSTFLMNLLVNMYRLNKISVSMVSLEMNLGKNTRRIMSRLTKIPYRKFVNKALTADERKRALDAWGKFQKFGKKHGAKFAMLCPDHSVSAENVLDIVRPLGFGVIGIDYVSLLEGVDTDNQARILSSIVRQCKIFSSKNHCLVVLLVQLDSDSGKIRYSRGMLEHADFALVWKYDNPEVRDTRVLPINIAKARDANLLQFDLSEQFDIMTIANMDEAPNPISGESSPLAQEEPAKESYEAGQK